MSDGLLNMTQYAKRVRVSRQRIGQFKADGRLDGCFIMEGRTCWIDPIKADKRIKETVDISQPGKKASPPAPLWERNRKWWREFSDAIHELRRLAELLDEDDPARSILEGRTIGIVAMLSFPE